MAKSLKAKDLNRQAKAKYIKAQDHKTIKKDG